MALTASTPIPPFKIDGNGVITQRRAYKSVEFDFSVGGGTFSVLGAPNQQLMSFDDGVSGGTAFWYSSGQYELFPTTDASYGLGIGPQSAEVPHINLQGNAGDPTSPLDGDFWYNGTADELKYRFGTFTRSIGSKNFSNGNSLTLGGFTYDGWATYTDAGVPIVGAGQVDLGGGNLANFFQVGVTTGTIGAVMGIFDDTLAGDPDIANLSSFSGIVLGADATDTATGRGILVKNGAGGNRFQVLGADGLITQLHSVNGNYFNSMRNTSNGALAITGWGLLNDTGSAAYWYKTSSGASIAEALVVTNEDGTAYFGGVRTAIGSVLTPIVTDANFEGGHSVKVTNANGATYTVDSGAGTDDYIIQSNYTATGAQTITLPAAATNGGRVLIIKDADGNAGANNITIDGNGAETIDGAATYVMSTNYDSVTLYCDATEWFTI